MVRRGSQSNTEEPRPEIAASWARSSLSGVPGDRLAPAPSSEADPEGRLATLAASVLDRLSSTLSDTRTTVVLTDARAGILDRRAGTASLGGLLDNVGLVPGYSYAEDVVGTNGMGTAAEERRAVRVCGSEHRAIVARLDPTGARRVGPEVVQALSRVDLPGNLRQLEAMLHRVVSTHRVGPITLDDLPPRGTRRHPPTPPHQPGTARVRGHRRRPVGRRWQQGLGCEGALASPASTLYRKLTAYGLQLDRHTF